MVEHGLLGATLDLAYASNLSRKPTEQFGLCYRPTLEPGMSDDADRHFDHTAISPPGGVFSDRNEEALKDVIASINPLKWIIEIGCWGGSSRDHSSTDCLLEAKPSECWYNGVDIADDGRSEHIRNPSKRQEFIHEDSTLYAQRWIGFNRDGDVAPVDLLFIDGKHSVNQVLSDFRLAELVRPGGVVVLHDINYHPGPRLLFDAVNPDVFDKSSVCPQADDYGLGVLRRK